MEVWTAGDKATGAQVMWGKVSELAHELRPCLPYPMQSYQSTCQSHDPSQDIPPLTWDGGQCYVTTPLFKAPKKLGGGEGAFSLPLWTQGEQGMEVPPSPSWSTLPKALECLCFLLTR